MKNKKKYYVIYIDDSKDAMDSLETDILRSALELKHVQYLDEGMKELNSFKYKGAIIDGEGLISKNDDVPAKNHLIEAIARIKDLETIQKRHIPIVVYTGYKEEFQNFIPQNIRIYSKDDFAYEMFEYLRAEIEKSEDTKIDSKFQDVFKVFHKEYLPASEYQNLLIVLKGMNSGNLPDIQNHLTMVRSMLESIKNEMEKILKKTFSDFKDFRHFLEGSPIYKKGVRTEVTPRIVPSYISHHMKNIYGISSIFIHSKNLEPNKYTSKSVIYAYLDVLRWYYEWRETKKL
tara:strand:- start:82 stop:948 length:867 start_codon:yes stop_codon:yes gene_type:complete